LTLEFQADERQGASPKLATLDEILFVVSYIKEWQLRPRRTDAHDQLDAISKHIDAMVKAYLKQKVVESSDCADEGWRLA
jgi:hypothetical protein